MPAGLTAAQGHDAPAPCPVAWLWALMLRQEGHRKGTQCDQEHVHNHAGAGRAACDAVVLVLFLAHEGDASSAFLRQGWIFTFRALLVLGEGGQTHHWHQGQSQEPHKDLCGGWFLAALGSSWRQPWWGRLPAQGPSVRATTASLGRAVGGELPHSAAAPPCLEQEEQKCQLPAAWEVSRISTHCPAEGAQGWGSGLGRWREPVCQGLAGAGLPWGLGCALGGATVELWELWLSTKPHRPLASDLFSSWTRFLLHAMIKKDVPLHKMLLPQHQSRENYSLQCTDDTERHDR